MQGSPPHNDRGSRGNPPVSTTTLQERLDECPFCGGTATLYASDGETDWHWISCDGCGVTTGVRESREAAVGCWQRRSGAADAF